MAAQGSPISDLPHTSHFLTLLYDLIYSEFPGEQYYKDSDYTYLTPRHSTPFALSRLLSPSTGPIFFGTQRLKQPSSLRPSVSQACLLLG